ncbi:MAG TPA: sigma-70 family RNA polymerase sigma factor [Gemmata sp.]|jgi:RNA polymerase sigma factor (sigma-70 family)|nr:sigma-70 family RNA polymerase sigma factor [Gemmata sp.]
MATSPKSEVILHLRRTVLLHDVAALTDAQLLEDYIIRRDDAAIAVLVQRHALMVWGVCRRVLSNYHDAEDAFQATFLVLVRKASSIASRELLANWLYGVAHQTALKARATAAKRKRRESQVKEMPEPAVLEQDRWPDLQPLLDQELSQLPDKYRVVIVLCDLEGKTRKQAAEQLGCPEGTVAGRLARARAVLAKRLTRHGLAVSSVILAAALSPGIASSAVPVPLVSNAIEAASALSSGQAATGLISAQVTALTEGVLKAMLITKLKIATAVLFAVTMIALTCGVLAGQKSELLDEVKSMPQMKSVRPINNDHFQVARRQADEPKFQPIDAATIAAYKKLGARVGRFAYTPAEFFRFSGGDDEATKGLPGFAFRELTDGKVPKLPAVSVPFGLCFADRKPLDSGVGDEGMKELKDLKNLTVLDLTDTLVTDEGMKELKVLRSLTSLNLGSTKIGNEGMKELKELKNLRHLILQGSQVMDEGLKEVKELKNLTALFLNLTRVGDEGMSELKELKNLSTLYLGFTQVGDAGLAELKNLKSLTQLDLMKTTVGDAGLKELRELKNLTHLNLFGTAVTNEGLAELKDLQNLTELDIAGTQVSDAGLKELKALKSLAWLDLLNTAVTDAGMKELKEIKTLTTLSLAGTGVTDAGLRELHDLKKLNSIELSNTKVTDEGVKDLKRALPNCLISR